ncbi:hypothetical protein VTH82DRAFT_3170 [Thermothelomyces myriococcoides]
MYGSRRRGEEEEEEGEDDGRWWEPHQRVVEEVDTDDDMEMEGVGPDSKALSRRVSSATGSALGNGDGNNARSRRGYAHQDREDDETTDESDADSNEDDGVRVPLMDPEEEALADRAMARIQRAQAKGKQDVKLSKEELAAYQKRLQLMQMGERRQRREQRVAIPISQLGPGFRQKRPSAEDDSPPPQELTPDSGLERHATYPPMGYFSPPSSRSLPRSGTTSSTPPSHAAPDSDQGSSPFTYSYVRHEQPEVDPFQYMTAGTRTSYHAAAAVPGRNGAAEVDDIYASRRHSGEFRREPVSSDDADDRPRGTRVASGSSRPRHKDSTDSRREPVPEPRPSRDRSPPPPVKKSSSTASSALVPKRKSTISGASKSGKKKGK